MEDYPLWLEISNRARIEYIDESMATYRVHRTSLTQGVKKHQIVLSALKIRLWSAKKYNVGDSIICKIEKDILVYHLKMAFNTHDKLKAEEYFSQLRNMGTISLSQRFYYMGSKNKLINTLAKLILKLVKQNN
jgi:ribosomal protein S4E